jgi:uncharacterized protein YfaS (alpha-2-macroglobulin family)
VAATQREVWMAGDDEQWFANATTTASTCCRRRSATNLASRRASRCAALPPRTVLVTVEREGILDTYVRRLSGRDQTISIPVKASYAPNVFVSALVVRGRVAGVQPTALVDLGKPAYKLGIAPMKVGWKGARTEGRRAADKAVYKVREHAQVAVQGARPDGARLPAGTEVALAAVDAGLLELMPNTAGICSRR